MAKKRKTKTMKITDFEAVSNMAKRIASSNGKDLYFEDYRVILRVGKSRFVLADEASQEIELTAVSEYLAKQEAIQILAMNGWSLVNDEALVMEVERVYATRYDCKPVPEGVRQEAA